ncbi:MAG: bacteriophage abortive infection AbiH family protein [Ruminococcus sp.]|jgi:hypothetical protein|nr:bacteriophage abortive infection AbiH family protein [Ruminococcus sp.]
MANVTWLIGNGFDLNVGLKTSYKDFYKEYIKDNNDDSENIKWFKLLLEDDMCNGWKNWADFEIGLGNESIRFINEDRIKECYLDFKKQLITFLKYEADKVDFENLKYDKTSTIIEDFSDSLLGFYDMLHMIKKKEFDRFAKLDNGELNIIQLNYTDIFDKLFTFSHGIIQHKIHNSLSYFDNLLKISSVRENIHLHGFLDYSMTLGVDNIQQIKNVDFHNETDINSLFVKQNYISIVEELRANDNIGYGDFYNIIDKSHIICSFGASIGESDKTCWETIGETIVRKDCQFIIFDIESPDMNINDPLEFYPYSNRVKNKKAEILNRFYKCANWTNEEIAMFGNNIKIELDSKLFNFKLPMKQSPEKDSVGEFLDRSTSLKSVLG